MAWYMAQVSIRVALLWLAAQLTVGTGFAQIATPFAAQNIPVASVSPDPTQPVLRVRRDSEADAVATANRLFALLLDGVGLYTLVGERVNGFRRPVGVPLRG
jgi:hypothetical protein